MQELKESIILSLPIIICFNFSGEVIRAFDLGVPTMKLHEKCVFTCAPEYAYGADGIPPTIPPNATLIMEVIYYRLK